MTDSEIQDFDYEHIEEIDYKKYYIDFLTRWCARCQNRNPMTRADIASNEFAIKVQEWLDIGEWPND